MPRHYSVEYRPLELLRGREFTRSADQRDEAEKMVLQLLSAGSRSTAIQRAGVVLPGPQSEGLLTVSSERLAAGMLRTSLALAAVEVQVRCGHAA